MDPLTDEYGREMILVGAHRRYLYVASLRGSEPIGAEAIPYFEIASPIFGTMARNDGLNSDVDFKYNRF